MARTRLYRKGVLEATDFPVEQVSDHLQDPTAVVWLDLCDPAEADLDVIREELGLHALAVEDALAEHQRPKLDRYATHAFLAVYAVKTDEHTGQLSKSEINAFVTPNALVTVHKDDFDMDAVAQRWDSSADLAKGGVGFLLHGLLDGVVDGHLVAAQALDDRIEAMEDQLFDDRLPHPDVQRRALRLRKSLLSLRRVVMPMREVLSSLMHRDHHIVDDAMMPYFQDVYDHVLFAWEWVESLRELVTTLRETQLNLQGNRMNNIMKKVTSWAAIIAVPTAITGFYGQNVPYPGYSAVWGFWVSAASIVVVSGGLYALFKRRDWL
jgi:magnesium transporter